MAMCSQTKEPSVCSLHVARPRIRCVEYGTAVLEKRRFESNAFGIFIVRVINFPFESSVFPEP